MFLDDVQIDINEVINSRLPIESYFLLYCIKYEFKSKLETYTEKCGLISKSTIDDLILKGYLIPIEDDITFSKLKLGFKGESLFPKLNYDLLFTELRNMYPKKTPLGRSLHTDIDNTYKRYRKIVKTLKTHKEILSCIRLYVFELKRTGRFEFIQALPAFINQKTYKTYLEDIKLLNDSISNTEENNTV